jgi:hypothetical protein
MNIDVSRSHPQTPAARARCGSDGIGPLIATAIVNSAAFRKGRGRGMRRNAHRPREALHRSVI